MATSLLTSIFGLIALIVLIAPISLYYAWAASHLWAWFMVPLGLPVLGILQIWGVTLTLSMLRPKIKADKTEHDWSTTMVSIILGPLFALGFGYAIKFWWM